VVAESHDLTSLQRRGTKYERGTVFIQTVIMKRDHMGVGREKEQAYTGPPWMFRDSDSTKDQKNPI
jgi:hypothetical protein